MTEPERFTREEFADELEARGSLLCDCDNPDGSPPTRHGRRLDHHCDCAAVRASATIRRGESVTRHGRECGCLVVDNLAREGLELGPLPQEQPAAGDDLDEISSMIAEMSATVDAMRWQSRNNTPEE